ncbi:MAG: ribonuclease III [Muribaculaceae bacterium]
MISDLIHIIKLPFSHERELYVFFRNIIGFYPRNLRYYNEALIHSSAQAVDRNGKHIDNERLEYLGDAVLTSVVSNLLFRRFPERNEGFLTDTRAKIIKREHLNQLGLSFGIDKYIRQARHSHSHNNYIYGNAVEALIGAIYLDRGYKYAERFILTKVIDRELDQFANDNANFKSTLIEWSQKQHIDYEFSVVDTRVDADGSPVFVASVAISGIQIATGKGYTKKEAHQNAAKEAMCIIKRDRKMRAMILDAARADSASKENANEQMPAEKPAKTQPTAKKQPKETKKPDKPEAQEPTAEADAESVAEQPKAKRRRKRKPKAQIADAAVAAAEVEEAVSQIAEAEGAEPVPAETTEAEMPTAATYVEAAEPTSEAAEAVAEVVEAAEVQTDGEEPVAGAQEEEPAAKPKRRGRPRRRKPKAESTAEMTESQPELRIEAPTGEITDYLPAEHA